MFGDTILGFALDNSGRVSCLCPLGDIGLVLVGKEKLTDPLLSDRAAPPSSDVPDELDVPGLRLDTGDAGFGSTLDPLPLVLKGGGEAILSPGESILAALREDFAGTAGAAMFFGIAGTGGASMALGTGEERDGDCSRKVRSVIEPELPRRTSADPGGLRTEPATELPAEEVDPFRRMVLLVWTSATDVGVVGLDRNAAAAAAEDKEAFEGRWDRNAEAAAVAAAALTLDEFNGCEYKNLLAYVATVAVCGSRVSF